MKRSYSSFVSVILTLCLLLQCLILPPIFANAETGTPDVTILYEDISLRQEQTKHFLCSDGSYLAISYPEPVHYLDKGEWKDIDNRLFYDETAGRYVNSENPTYQVSLDGAGKVSTMVSESETITWQVSLLTDKKQNKAEKKNGSVKNQEKSSVKNKKVKNAQSLNIATTSSSVIFESAFGKKYPIDLEYIIGQNKIKENVIFNKSSDAIGVAWDLSLPDGAYPVIANDNSVCIYRSDDTLLSVIGVPYAYDQLDSYCYDIEATLAQTNKGWQIRYIIDSEWLEDASRQYPVVLDPIVTMNYAIKEDAYYEAILDNTAIGGGRNYLWIESGVVSSGYHYSFVDLNFPSINTAMYDITAANLCFTIKDGFYSGTAGLYRVPDEYRQAGVEGMVNNEAYRYRTEDFVCMPTRSGDTCYYNLLLDDTSGFSNLIGYLSGIDSNGYTLNESVYGSETRLCNKDSTNPPTLQITYRSKNLNNMCVTLQNAYNNNYIQASGSTIGLVEEVSDNATEIFKLVLQESTGLYRLCPVNDETKCIAVSGGGVTLLSSGTTDSGAFWKIQKSGTKYAFVNTTGQSTVYLSVTNSALSVSSTLSNSGKWKMEDAYSMKAQLGDDVEFVIINKNTNKSLEYASLWSDGVVEQSVAMGEFDATVDLTVPSGSGYTAEHNVICQRFKLELAETTDSEPDYYILPYLRLEDEVKGSYREEYRLAINAAMEPCIVYCPEGTDPTNTHWEFWGDVDNYMLVNRLGGSSYKIGMTDTDTGCKIATTTSSAYKWEVKPICLNVEKTYQKKTNTCAGAVGAMLVNYLFPSYNMTETDYIDLAESLYGGGAHKDPGYNKNVLNYLLSQNNIQTVAYIRDHGPSLMVRKHRIAMSISQGFPAMAQMYSSTNTDLEVLGYTSSSDGHYMLVKGQYYNPVTCDYEVIINDPHYMYEYSSGGRDLITTSTHIHTLCEQRYRNMVYIG